MLAYECEVKDPMLILTMNCMVVESVVLTDARPTLTRHFIRDLPGQLNVTEYAWTGSTAWYKASILSISVTVVPG